MSTHRLYKPFVAYFLLKVLLVLKKETLKFSNEWYMIMYMLLCLS